MSPPLADYFPETDSNSGHRALQDPKLCSKDALLLSDGFDIVDLTPRAWSESAGSRRYPPTAWYNEDDDDYDSDGEYIEDNYGCRGYDGEHYDCDGEVSAIQGNGSGGCWRRPDIEPGHYSLVENVVPREALGASEM